MTESSADTMHPETTTAGPTEFLAAHPSLFESLHTQAGADRWSLTRQEFAAALYRSAAHITSAQRFHPTTL